MERFELTSSCSLVLEEGDLTRADVDAIVNAANQRMLGGGGVDGAIHQAAGPRLVEACREVPEVRPGVRCPTGEARITPGFDLPARHVIHTVGPVYESPEVSAPLLKSAYRSSLALALADGLRTIAFPAISCGVYGYPLEEAAEIAIETSLEYRGRLAEVRFVLFGQPTYELWRDVAKRLLGG
ncbi:MAG: O-acetyl-ADP-ribose deacetylase [Planctomycetota bacterium]|nr:O-acetyl-ADP-ribose deacetylase [Planctomycetota bacterium]